MTFECDGPAVRPYVKKANANDDISSVRYVISTKPASSAGTHTSPSRMNLKQALVVRAPKPRLRHLAGLFAQDMRAHGGDPLAMEHACIDMITAYAKGIGKSLPNAQIAYECFRLGAQANSAMDEVRREEMRSSTADVRETGCAPSEEALRQLLWGGCANAQCEALHGLQRSNLTSTHLVPESGATGHSARLYALPPFLFRS